MVNKNIMMFKIHFKNILKRLTSSGWPKSATINWSLPGLGNWSWRILTAPRLPLERLSYSKKNTEIKYL